MSKNRLQSKASRSQPSKTIQKPLHSRFGSFLGSVLGGFGCILGSLGRLLDTLRHSWAPLVGLLCVPWAFLGCLPSLFEASWAPLKRFGIDFGTFCGWFGRNLGGSGPQNNCFFKASPPLSLKPPNGLANRTSNFPTSGLQSASAGRAKRKLF